MIREFQVSDTEQVMQLWISGNEDAHPFIPKEYWYSHFDEVQEAYTSSCILSQRGIFYSFRSS